MTEFQKKEILVLKGLMSHSKIGIRLSIPRPTITSFLEHIETRESIETILRPATSQETSNSDDCYIMHTAECNARISLKELRADTISNISE